ncbi:triple tyrosine motif-containing protein [Mucilaginibacter gossypii]|uniref:sensor histidine kinase n=1 Tax=Mucilaginibacter gossypii TaxID=551996 RepID=UPI00167A8207|nr:MULTISPECIES: triple tyrosine motif-containing protein [Mucilaginibacter]QTE38588.1 triple tyrosine motif-containing protein [Mucilaginibacter gossypii]
MSNKDILCGQSNGLMLLRRSDGRLTQLDRLHLYHHMFNDPNRRIWLSRDDGLFILDRTKAILPATSIYPEFKKYKTYTINSHLRLGDSLVVMGTENDQGILLWYYKRRLVKKVDISSVPSLASNSVNNIYLDKRGRLWVLSDKTITVISNTFSKSSFPDFISDQKYTKLSLFFDMCEAMGSYWIASYGNGIIQVNNKGQILKLLSLKDGLSNDGLYNIFNIGDSSLVMTSNNGLSVYHLRNHKFKNYFSENGLHSNGFEEVSSTVDQEKIYAGGINGFTVIDPSRLTTNKKPPLFYYKNVEVKLSNGENSVNTCIAVQKVNIHSNWLQTTISFSGINFDDPKRVDYRYRIKEIDSNWINNGHRDQISLIGLRPETYTLEVKASNEDGFWSQPKSLTLVVKPKWYETWWFKTGIMITVVSVFGLVYRYRIKQVKIQQQIRREIANDLHDDLGSNLNSIKIFTHLALEEKDKNDYLMELHELVGSTLTGLRDMLWVLEDDHDDVNGLVARINKFALPIAGAQQVDFYCSTQGFDTVGLTKKEKRNLFLIIKESINNSFKHAQCSRLTVTIGANKTKITVRVSDNGQGFSYTEKAESYGIRNIIYRATQIGYQAGITSVTGKGTTIVVEKK